MFHCQDFKEAVVGQFEFISFSRGSAEVAVKTIPFGTLSVLFRLSSIRFVNVTESRRTSHVALHVNVLRILGKVQFVFLYTAQNLHRIA